MELVPLGLGLLAGLALAVPLGAIGVLLVHEGATRGWARGVPAAGAVASVDVVYCLVAAAAGSAVAPVLTAWDPWPQTIGGAALLAVAATGAIRTLRRATSALPPQVAASASPSWQRYALFLGLTAINPATLLSFAAITAGVSAVTSSVGSAALFVAGVGAASLSWQLLLVAAGAWLRTKATHRWRLVTSVIGHGIVAVLGVAMIAQGFPAA